MDINNLITVIGGIIVAVLGASGFFHVINKRDSSKRKSKDRNVEQKNKSGNNIYQSISNGSNNTQIGGNGPQ